MYVDQRVTLALELGGRHNLNSHDRFKYNTTSFLECFSVSADRSKSERQLRRVNRVESPVLQNHATARNLITRQRSLLQGFIESLTPHNTERKRKTPL